MQYIIILLYFCDFVKSQRRILTCILACKKQKTKKQYHLVVGLAIGHKYHCHHSKDQKLLLSDPVTEGKMRR